MDEIRKELDKKINFFDKKLKYLLDLCDVIDKKDKYDSYIRESSISNSIYQLIANEIIKETTILINPNVNDNSIFSLLEYIDKIKINDNVYINYRIINKIDITDHNDPLVEYIKINNHDIYFMDLLENCILRIDYFNNKNKKTKEFYNYCKILETCNIINELIDKTLIPKENLYSVTSNKKYIYECLDIIDKKCKYIEELTQEKNIYCIKNGIENSNELENVPAILNAFNRSIILETKNIIDQNKSNEDNISIYKLLYLYNKLNLLDQNSVYFNSIEDIDTKNLAFKKSFQIRKIISCTDRNTITANSIIINLTNSFDEENDVIAKLKSIRNHIIAHNTTVTPDKGEIISEIFNAIPKIIYKINLLSTMIRLNVEKNDNHIRSSEIIDPFLMDNINEYKMLKNKIKKLEEKEKSKQDLKGVYGDDFPMLEYDAFKMLHK